MPYKHVEEIMKKHKDFFHGIIIFCNGGRQLLYTR